jgi:hypothetical protein
MKAQIPKNIKKYKKTVVGNFDLRQCIIIGASLIIGYFLYKIMSSFGLTIDIKMIVIALICGLLIATGCFKHNGIYAEKILFNIILDSLYHVNYRPYKKRGFKIEKE